MQLLAVCMWLAAIAQVVTRVATCTIILALYFVNQTAIMSVHLCWTNIFICLNEFYLFEMQITLVAKCVHVPYA